MQATHSNQEATLTFTSLTFLAGVLCIAAAVIGRFWISRIIPGIYSTLSDSGFSFMSNSMTFHIVWAIFFLSLLITGIKLTISALNKRTKDLVPGLSLYFLGASLVIIGMFYLVFGQFTYALIAIISGALCIYFEGAAEIT